MAPPPPRLLAPSIVPALAALLHPSTDAAVLLAALDLLAAAAAGPHPARLAGWGLTLFKCVPLLQLGMSSNAGASEAVMATLNLVVVLSGELPYRGLSRSMVERSVAAGEVRVSYVSSRKVGGGRDQDKVWWHCWPS